MAQFNFTSPTIVSFGEDSINEIARITKKYGKRALIMTNMRSFGETGVIDNVTNILKKNGIDYNIFGDINEYGDSQLADSAAQIAVYGQSDVIIAIGGFDTLNLGKAAATVATNGGEASDYLFDVTLTNRKEFVKKREVHYPLMPLILVPTIVGTGSEITTDFYIRDKYDDTKKQAFSPKITAAECIIDPKIQLTIPSKFLASSAVSIYAFAFEVFIGKEVNPISDALAIHSMELVIQNLQNMVEDQLNVDHRTSMCMASLIVSIAINSSRCGALRALSLAVKNVSGAYTGVTITVLLPHLMDYNLTAATGKFIQIVKLFGEDTSDMSVIEASIKSTELIRRFLSKFNLPMRLTEINVKHEDFEEIARQAIKFQEMQNIPREMSYDEIITLLDQAF